MDINPDEDIEILAYVSTQAAHCVSWTVPDVLAGNDTQYWQQ